MTGGEGFVGSHLTEALISAGAEVTVLDLYHPKLAIPHDHLPHSPRFVRGDVADGSLVRDTLHGASVIFHLAALISVPHSYRSPASFVSTNIQGTLAVLEAIRQGNTEAKLIHTSTSEVYGSAQFVPMSETHPLRAQSPYAASKIGADQLALSYARAFGLSATVIRPFNLYGPRQSLRAIIPSVIAQAMYTSEIRVGSIWPRRDFTYVSDVVDAYIALAQNDRLVGEVVNVGSGVSVSVKQLIKDVCELVGREPTVIVDQERIRPAASEVDNLVCDAAKAARCIDYSPSVDLRSGLQRVVDWIGSNPPSNPSHYSL